jgi:hypothetical protein
VFGVVKFGVVKKQFSLAPVACTCNPNYLAAEIWRITVRGQIVCETPIPNITRAKWIGSIVHSSSFECRVGGRAPTLQVKCETAKPQSHGKYLKNNFLMFIL